MRYTRSDIGARTRFPAGNGTVTVQRSARSGFVLVLVLAVLVIAMLISAFAMRFSLTMALRAADAEESLQERWGRFSLQRTILAGANNILEDIRESKRSSGSSERVRHLTLRFALGNLDFELLLADEDAKLNLNTVYYMRSESAVEQSVRKLFVSANQLPLRLRPFQETGESSGAPVFDSWGQVFELDRRPDAAALLQEMTREISCWGTGLLNVTYASDESLNTACATLVRGSTIDRLKVCRATGHYRKLGALLDAAVVTDSERRQLGELLTVRSQCYSLWIISRHHGSSKYSLHIAELANGQRPYVSSFAW